MTSRPAHALGACRPKHLFKGAIYLCIGALICFASLSSRAQSVEEFEYKFQVLSVDQPSAAKSIQAEFIAYSLVIDVRFIDELDVFKLRSSSPLPYVFFTSVISQAGHSIEGKIQVGDGSILGPPQSDESRE